MTVGETLYTFDDNPVPPVKLYYFDIVGKAEGIRRALYHAHVPFVDVRLDRATFREKKEKGEFAFGQVPALLTADGKNLLVQSGAIYHYIHKIGKVSLYPDDAVEAAKVDAMLYEEADLCAGLLVSTYPSRFGFGFLDSEPDKVKEIRKVLNDDILPHHLANIERTIDPGPWLAGQAHPTIADFAMVYRIKALATNQYKGLSTDILKPYVKILAMISAFDALPVSSVEFGK